MAWTIDFETYYSKEYSLSKMTTEQYIRSPEFQIIGVAIKENDGPSQWYSFDNLNAYRQVLAHLKDEVVIAHNAMFDVAILDWVLGIRPKVIADTLSMARPLHGSNVGGSLKALAEHYAIGVKGTEVIDALGKRLEDFTPDELDRYGKYCKNDVDLTYDLFKILLSKTNKREMKLIDRTIRMFTEPVLELDRDILSEHLETVKEKRTEALKKVVKDYPKLIADAMVNNDLAGIEEAARAILASNPQLAAVLRDLGVEPPMKESKATGAPTYAFGKTDKEFLALLDHPDVRVQAVVEARLDTKSSIELTRTEAFLAMSHRGAMPVPLSYCGATTTWRWSGMDKINLQNLPRGGRLRHAIVAPEGYVLVSCDSSNIELRVNHTLAGQESTVIALRNGEDLYCEFASMIFGRPITKADRLERMLGKTCLSGESLVLCLHENNVFWCRIDEFRKEYQIWDGEEWVWSDGLVMNGWKRTQEISGLWLTPDHQVLCGADWKEAQYLAQDANTLSQALDTGAENLPSQATSEVLEAGYQLLLLNATAEGMNTQSTTITSKTLSPQNATYAPKNQRPQIENYTGGMLESCRTTTIEHDYLIDYHQPYLDAATHEIGTSKTMGVEALKCLELGCPTEVNFLGMSKRSPDGMSQSLKWIESTPTEGTSRETFGSYQGETTCLTSEKYQNYKQELKSLKNSSLVYDIANAGPRHRFTVLTSAGPLIVHNCHLGLGYGMGAAKFADTVRIQSKGEIILDEAEAKRIVNLWRDTYGKIPAMWKQAEGALSAIANYQEAEIGGYGLVKTAPTGLITAPDNYILYPNLRREEGAWVYDAKFGRSIVANKIYGGKVVENICQHLARNIIGEQWLTIASRYKVVLQVHDEVVALVPEEEAQEATDWMVKVMSTSPEWWPDIPLAAEASFAKSFE